MSITENRVEFKSLEEKVFKYVCECGREILKEILESYGEEIRESRDKKECRSKGKRKRTIKTVMGEIEFERNVYERLLCLKMTGKLSEKIGAISTVCLPERYAEEQTIILSASKVPLRVGKGYNGFTKGGAFPVNGSYGWLRNIGRI